MNFIVLFYSPETTLSNVDFATMNFTKYNPTATSAVAYGNATIYRCGKIGIIAIGCRANTTANTDVVMFNSAIKPAVAVAETYDVGNNLINVTFNTAGQVVVYPYNSALPNSTWVRRVFPFIVAD